MIEMKAALYLSEKNLVVGTLNKPTIQPGEALIKVSSAGICGTDMMIFFGKHPRAKAPLAMAMNLVESFKRLTVSLNLTLETELS